MTRIKSNTHHSSAYSQESNSRAGHSSRDAFERLADTLQDSSMDELRAIVAKVGGPQAARRLLADGSHQLPSIDPASRAESLNTLVELLAGQHSTQEFGKAEGGE